MADAISYYQSSLSGGCKGLVVSMSHNGMTCLRMSGNDSLYGIVSAKELNVVSLGPHNSIEDVIKQ